MSLIMPIRKKYNILTRWLRWASASNPLRQSQDNEPMVVYCWSSVVDGGPTINHHRSNDLCLLGPQSHIEFMFVGCAESVPSC